LPRGLATAVRIAAFTFALCPLGVAEAKDPEYDAQALQGEEEGAPPFEVEAYVEANYQWNFGNPSNGITHLRGFDNRHNTFTLANVALGGSWDASGAFGHVMLQVGHTPSTYYLSE